LGERPLARFMMIVLWPAFLMAVAASGVLFSLVDPHELHAVGKYLPEHSDAACTIGFLMLWALFAANGALTWSLMRRQTHMPE
jgi:hypothetical protein